MTLIAFVTLYLLATVAIGLYAASRVKSTADFAVAGRSLPLIMVVTTTFATWFGSETVLGIPSKFVQGGLSSTVEDPFGAAFCLIFVGAFFAAKLYRMNLLTIGDFYRARYGKGVEIFSSTVILISYLGWVAAPIIAYREWLQWPSNRWWDPPLDWAFFSLGAVAATWSGRPGQKLAGGLGAIRQSLTWGPAVRRRMRPAG